MAKKKNIVKAPREMTHRQLSHYQRQQRRQRVIFFSGIAIIVVVVLIILAGWFAGEYLPLHKTIFQVYDTQIDTSFFIDALVIYGRNQDSAGLANLATSVASQIMQNELIKQEAAKLGISVSDEEAIQRLQSANIPVNIAAIELARGDLLATKVRTGHFGSLAPTSDNQVWVKALMMESYTMAQQVREKIVSGENFTKLVEQYAVDAASKQALGDYGWHPISILKEKLTAVPLNYASRADAKAGDLSQPLTDNTTSKQVGYWLIRVNARPDPASANVSALFLENEEEALDVLAKLQAGEDLASLASQYSQFGTSRENQGEMGIVIKTDNVTDIFNGYVFNEAIEVGEWSQPVRENTLYTQGGYWIVQVAGKEENKPLTTEDRDKLINALYSSWLNEISTAATPYVVNNLTAEIQQWAVDKATDILKSG